MWEQILVGIAPDDWLDASGDCQLIFLVWLTNDHGVQVR